MSVWEKTGCLSAKTGVRRNLIGLILILFVLIGVLISYKTFKTFSSVPTVLSDDSHQHIEAQSSSISSKSKEDLYEQLVSEKTGSQSLQDQEQQEAQAKQRETEEEFKARWNAKESELKKRKQSLAGKPTVADVKYSSDPEMQSLSSYLRTRKTSRSSACFDPALFQFAIHTVPNSMVTRDIPQSAILLPPFDRNQPGKYSGVAIESPLQLLSATLKPIVTVKVEAPKYPITHIVIEEIDHQKWGDTLHFYGSSLLDLFDLLFGIDSHDTESKQKIIKAEPLHTFSKKLPASWIGQSYLCFAALAKVKASGTSFSTNIKADDIRNVKQIARQRFPNIYNSLVDHCKDAKDAKQVPIVWVLPKSEQDIQYLDIMVQKVRSSLHIASDRIQSDPKLFEKFRTMKFEERIQMWNDYSFIVAVGQDDMEGACWSEILLFLPEGSVVSNVVIRDGRSVFMSNAWRWQAVARAIGLQVNSFEVFNPLNQPPSRESQFENNMLWWSKTCKLEE
mmetsp:Transcript_10251/g.18457  ORF Transcript_10251/g.18457 Transcript_10251/m.18457 type:complete len:506 (-) Transcript_10251:58-1575(-)